MSFNSDLERFMKKLTATGIKTVKDIGGDLLTEVKDETPVDTGTLKEAWEKEAGINQTIISNNTPYAGYVENGSENQDPAHMMLKAIDKVKTKINNGGYK